MNKTCHGFNMIAEVIGKEATEMLFECCDSRGRLFIPEVLKPCHITALIGSARAEILFDHFAGQRIKITSKKETYMEIIVKACITNKVPKYIIEETLKVPRYEVDRIIKKVLPAHPT